MEVADEAGLENRVTPATEALADMAKSALTSQLVRWCSDDVTLKRPCSAACKCIRKAHMLVFTKCCRCPADKQCTCQKVA